MTLHIPDQNRIYHILVRLVLNSQTCFPMGDMKVLIPDEDYAEENVRQPLLRVADVLEGFEASHLALLEQWI